MRNVSSIVPAVMATALLAAGGAEAGFTYDELLDGDLSNDPSQPTVLAPGVGSNFLSGNFAPPPGVDGPGIDYLSMTVPVGLQLSEVRLLSASVGGAFSFIGVAAGPTIPFPYNEPDPSLLLGWAHFGSADIGSDLLPPIGDGPGAIGFDGPLPSGTYTFWLMELEGSPDATYSFDFVLTSVPAPACVWLPAAALALGRRRRRAAAPTAR